MVGVEELGISCDSGNIHSVVVGREQMLHATEHRDESRGGVDVPIHYFHLQAHKAVAVDRFSTIEALNK